MKHKYAILHSEICDNYKRCPSMLRCEELAIKQGREAAIYLDDQQKIQINRKNCIGCEACIDRCGLFRVVDGIYQERIYLKEFKNDPRSSIDHTVERFGCDIMDSEYLLRTIRDVEEYMEGTKSEINILEFVIEQTAFCPIQGIVVEDIKSQLPEINEYRKFVIDSENEQYDKQIESFFTEQCHLLKLQSFPFPSVVLIKDNTIVGKPIEIRKVQNESYRNEQMKSLISQFLQQIKGLENNE